jgi:hypothetical protein
MPTGNQFSGNTVSGDGANPVKMSNGSVGNVFNGNSFGDAPSDEVIIQSGSGDVFTGNTFPAGQQFAVTGASGSPSSVSVVDPAVKISVSVDAFSSVDVKSSTGGQFTAAPSGPVTTDSPGGSDLLVPPASSGTNTFIITPVPVTVVPASGTVTSAVGSVSSTSVGFTVTSASGGATVNFSIGGFAPGASVVVTANGGALASLTADPTGTVTFSGVPGAGSTAYLAVSS